MVDQSLGPVGQEIETRIRAGLAPERLVIVNDSARHRGHAGDNGSGESHFTIAVTSAAFAGQSRLARQRMIHAALGDLLRERVHALAIRARAPDED